MCKQVLKLGMCVSPMARNGITPSVVLILYPHVREIPTPIIIPSMTEMMPARAR
jgi:hypothetical protein